MRGCNASIGMIVMLEGVNGCHQVSLWSTDNHRLG